MKMSDLQRYPDTNLEDTNVFLTQRMFNSYNFSIDFIGKKCSGHFCREPGNKNEQFKEANH